MIDPEFLAALPEDIRSEVIDQQRRERRQRERARERQRQQAAAQQVRSRAPSAVSAESSRCMSWAGTASKPAIVKPAGCSSKLLQQAYGCH